MSNEDACDRLNFVRDMARRAARRSALVSAALAGVIELTQAESDKRGRRAALTTAGRAAFDAYRAHLERIVRSARG